MFTAGGIKQKTTQNVFLGQEIFFDASAPYATGGVYINFVTQDETDRIAAAYGKNYKKLVRIKNKYDPNNLFRVNHNINPTV